MNATTLLRRAVKTLEGASGWTAEAHNAGQTYSWRTESPRRFEASLPGIGDACRIDDAVWLRGSYATQLLLPWTWPNDVETFLVNRWVKCSVRALKYRGLADYQPIVKWKRDALNLDGPVILHPENVDGCSVLERPDASFCRWIVIDTFDPSSPRVVRLQEVESGPSIGDTQFAWDQRLSVAPPSSTEAVIAIEDLQAWGKRIRREAAARMG